MKTIGIIGGLSPEATVDYYKRIITSFHERYPDIAYPEIVLVSTSLKRVVGLAERNEWHAVAALLIDRVMALSRAGADFAAIAANTPHIVFDEIRSQSPLPLLSIVEETCRKAEQVGVRTAGLMGTKFTMKSDFYQKAFGAKGMTIVVPDEKAQQFIHEKLLTELGIGIIKDSTRRDLLSIAEQMMAQHTIDALILGCTELPLILDTDALGIPFLNTTAIHVEGIINYCMQ